MIVHRYIGRQIVFHISMVLVVTGLIDLMTSILSEWSYGLEGNYQALQASWFVLVTLLGRLYDLFPLVVLIGCLTGLGGLANTSELTIVRSLGYSVNRITWLVVKPVILLLFIAMAAGELVVPKLDAYANAYRAGLSKDSASTRYGVWHKENDQVIYIGAAHAQGRLESVRLYSLAENGDPQQLVVADGATYDSGTWTLTGVMKTTGFQSGQLITNALTEQVWDTGLTPTQINNSAVSPERLGIWQLVQYITYLSDQGVNADKYLLAFWSKILLPVMSLSLVLVAASFIFGPLREVATGTRVFVGVLVGLVIKIIQNILGPASLLFGFQPLLAVLVPAVLTIFAGLWLLSRVY